MTHLHIQLLNIHHKIVSVFNTSQFDMPSQYPPSTTAYPHLNHLLDCLHLLDASSPSSTFSLSSTTIVSPQTTSSIVRPLPPISSPLPSFSVSSFFDALPLLPRDAVATSSHLQQFSAESQCSLGASVATGLY